MGSCTSWATTYYQFTYEAYKGTDIDLKDSENMNLAYAAALTFNFINGGKNSGSFIYKAIDSLKIHGALTQEEYPRTTSPSTFDYSWSEDTDAMIEALNLRVIDDGKVEISANNASDNLDEIKQLLYGTDGTDGHILTFSTQVYGWEYKDGINKETDETEKVAYRCYEGGGGHSMTIVGYNDDFWCDINENGEEDEGELGAFKIANSWGDNWQNSGYVWVAYDALNAETTVYGDWESEKDTNRIPIFQYEFSGKNLFYWIEVGDKTPMYVGQMTIDTNDRNAATINIGRNASTSENLESTVCVLKNYSSNTDKISYSGTVVFDYSELADPIGDYISGYNWFVRVSGDYESLSFKITDNLSNTIVDFGEIDTGDSYEPIDLSMGDLDYSGAVDDTDAKILFDALYKGGILSNLQKYLATEMSVEAPIRAAVTPSGFDDIGTVLDSIDAYNILWDTVPETVDLEALEDGEYDALFINCASSVNGDVISGFVEEGGTVYASDWALESLIDAFPEREFTYDVMYEQTIIADIVDDGLHTSTGLEEVSIEFDLGSWFLVTSELQSDVTVYIEGPVSESDSSNSPLVFSFPYGDNGGKVFYTSFHQGANNTQDMQAVLYDLVLKINHNKDINELEEWVYANEYDSMISVTSVLNAAETSDAYVLNTIENGQDFAVISDEASQLSVALTDPDGNTYTNYEDGEFVYGTISTSDGDVEVYSLGERGISVSNCAIEEESWTFKITSNASYRSSYVVGIAEKEESNYSLDDYSIAYNIAADWGTGQNIQITLTNTGDTTIRNWALQCDDFCGTISNVWNAVLYSDNIIQNATYNCDIAPGESITFGYTLTNVTGEIPVFTLCTFRSLKEDGYTVAIDVLSDWSSGFIGAITITNTTDSPIMAWELNFDAENFLITDTSQFVIIENTDNNYKITGTYNGNIPIPANTSITLQFNGIKTDIPTLSNVSLTEVVF